MFRSRSGRTCRFVKIYLWIAALFTTVPLFAQPSADPGCETYQAWTIQTNSWTDATGKNNQAYPEYNATYWGMPVTFPLGTVFTIKGQYPRARYMALQVYDFNRNVLSAIGDTQINPDPGQNNPYRTGVEQGTYTVQMVFGSAPDSGGPPNTIYSGGLTNVALVYRIYYANDPTNLPGGPVDPELPNITVNGGPPLTSCPVRPILPEEATLSGRLDDIDFIGTTPPRKPALPPVPVWVFAVTGPVTPFYPSQDNSYLSTVISRDYLLPPLNFDMAVIRMRPPTFVDTQAGVPPYTPANVRFWSMCQDEPLTTTVVRCIPDDQTATLNGLTTFVISDPSNRPSAAVLSRWGARWMPWGAMLPTDTIFDINGNVLTNSDGVFYYGLIIYRQTIADPNFRQSIENISKLPPAQRQSAMGNYLPDIGYCTSAAFQAQGAGCIRR